MLLLPPTRLLLRIPTSRTTLGARRQVQRSECACASLRAEVRFPLFQKPPCWDDRPTGVGGGRAWPSFPPVLMSAAAALHNAGKRVGKCRASPSPSAPAAPPCPPPVAAGAPPSTFQAAFPVSLLDQEVRRGLREEGQEQELQQGGPSAQGQQQRPAGAEEHSGQREGGEARRGCLALL